MLGRSSRALSPFFFTPLMLVLACDGTASDPASGDASRDVIPGGSEQIVASTPSSVAIRLDSLSGGACPESVSIFAGPFGAEILFPDFRLRIDGGATSAQSTTTSSTCLVRASIQSSGGGQYSVGRIYLTGRALLPNADDRASTFVGVTVNGTPLSAAQPSNLTGPRGGIWTHDVKLVPVWEKCGQGSSFEFQLGAKLASRGPASLTLTSLLFQIEQRPCAR